MWNSLIPILADIFDAYVAGPKFYPAPSEWTPTTQMERGFDGVNLVIADRSPVNSGWFVGGPDDKGAIMLRSLTEDPYTVIIAKGQLNTRDRPKYSSPYWSPVMPAELCTKTTLSVVIVHELAHWYRCFAGCPPGKASDGFGNEPWAQMLEVAYMNWLTGSEGAKFRGVTGVNLPDLRAYGEHRVGMINRHVRGGLRKAIGTSSLDVPVDPMHSKDW